MAFQRPNYISKGMFSWDGLGYAFADSPPSELLLKSALEDPNPWISFTAILMRAQTGDFASTPKIVQCLRDTDSWVLAGACSALLGDAGPEPLLRTLPDEFHSELFSEEVLFFQVYIAHTFYYSRLLWTVPLMLELHFRTADDKDASIIPILLSDMLEADSGPIARGVQASSKSAYRNLVLDKYNVLTDELGSENAMCYYGEGYSVKRLANRLYENLTGEHGNSISIAEDRHIFEAETGISCSSFFKAGQLQRLYATTIVEEFLDSGEADKYEPGVRYFFGHRIPD